MRSNAGSKKTTAAFSPLLLPLLSFFFFFSDHNPRTGSGVAAEPRTRRLPAAWHPRGAVVRRPTPRRQSAWLRCKIWKCHTKERLQLHYILLYHIVVQSVLSLIYFIFWWTLSNEGRIYQVLKAQHTQHGRGGATIQVELRDVDTGNKITERFRTDEAIERVFVEEKSFTFLYHEGDSVMLMEPNTFEQVEVPKELFGKAAGYLKEDMTVSVQYYDEKPMSASVPIRVTCTVVDAQPPSKGLTAAPQYKKVLLDNGLTVLAPPFIVTGDEIVINTMDDSYITRAKE